MVLRPLAQRHFANNISPIHDKRYPCDPCDTAGKSLAIGKISGQVRQDRLGYAWIA